MVDLPEHLSLLKRFHGHLGPYVVVGHRMGLIARERFPDRIWAVVRSGGERPMSCMIDGIQISSCCTMGKGNIEVTEDRVPAATFTDRDGSMEISLREEVWEMIKRETTHDTEETIARRIDSMDVDSLFEIR